MHTIRSSKEIDKNPETKQIILDIKSKLSSPIKNGVDNPVDMLCINLWLLKKLIFSVIMDNLKQGIHILYPQLWKRMKSRKLSHVHTHSQRLLQILLN